MRPPRSAIAPRYGHAPSNSCACAARSAAPSIAKQRAWSPRARSSRVRWAGRRTGRTSRIRHSVDVDTSADPRQLFADRQVDDPGAAQRRARHHHAGMVGDAGADHRGTDSQADVHAWRRARVGVRVAARTRAACPRWPPTAGRGRATRTRRAPPAGSGRRARRATCRRLLPCAISFSVAATPPRVGSRSTCTSAPVSIMAATSPCSGAVSLAIGGRRTPAPHGNS